MSVACRREDGITHDRVGLAGKTDKGSAAVRRTDAGEVRRPRTPIGLAGSTGNSRRENVGLRRCREPFPMIRPHCAVQALQNPAKTTPRRPTNAHV